MSEAMPEAMRELLSVLAEGPCYFASLEKQIHGSIYPLIHSAFRQDLITHEGPLCFKITEKGKEYLHGEY